VTAAWGDVLATALVGTDRRRLDVSGPSTVDDAAALLEVAAGLAVARRAGVRPALHKAETVPPAPDETAVVVLPAAALRLADLLAARLGYGGDGFDAATRADLLAEWLTLAGDRGWRVPPELLPDLLEVARVTPPLRALAAAVGGTRAGWLAAQHAPWAFALGQAVDSADPADWTDGTLGRRLGYLTALRKRDPAAGLALLAETWPDEAPEDRVALLGALSHNLGPGDEQFLEAVLDERRGELRAAAADLLAVLPGSAYGRRMADRAEASVRRQGKHLEIEPPEFCGTAMRRDGIQRRAPSGVGERAWWLEEIVARTNPETWQDPEEFTRLSIADEWAAVMLRGLTRAIVLHHAEDWAAPMLDRLAKLSADDEPLVESLYRILPEAERATRAVDLLRREAPGVDRLLELCPTPWPGPVAEAAIANLAGLATRKNVTTWRVRERTRLAATRLPTDPATLSRVERLATMDSPHATALGQLADVLRFRHDMSEELT